MKDSLVFIHLSDIHFKHIESLFELDTHLRNELERDLQRMEIEIDHYDSILITGDIAYSGKKEEYVIAKSWIEKLCNITKVKIENVWMVPGNHDVDRSIIANSNLTKHIHYSIRNLDDQNDYNDELSKWLRDKDGKRVILEALDNYNNFALPFECRTSTEQLFWETKDIAGQKTDFILNDGSKLRIIGINSVVISDEYDNDKANKLFVSTYQSQGSMLRNDGLEYLVMCHHPPEWLLDKDCNDNFSSLSRIQLMGHKHSQKIEPTFNTLRIIAGAVHPARKEQQWLPTYNIISLKVDTDHIEEKRTLVTKIWQRIWGEEQKFTGKYVDKTKSSFYEYKISLDYWRQLDKIIASSSDVSEEGDNMATDEITNLRRRLIYHFLSLSYIHKDKIATDLELKSEDDEFKSDEMEKFQNYFKRAVEKNILKELWDKVSLYRGQLMEIENPFNNI